MKIKHFHWFILKKKFSLIYFKKNSGLNDLRSALSVIPQDPVDSRSLKKGFFS